MKRLIQQAIAMMLALLFVLAPLGALAMVKPTNPLLGGLTVEPYTKTEDDFVHILLLGIDYGYEYSDYISCKTVLEDCHTDAIVVVSINKTQKTVDLVSMPRDTLTYVPGVKGIYKLNAAINCAEDIEKGIEKTRQAVSWHLGGIEIDHYVAVDVPALIALGDAIGGVEFDLEMSYTATSGYYAKGLQVLDGQGIMDYMRARKNATVNGTDLGRTERQRKMLSAILRKIKADPWLLKDVVKVLFSDQGNIFTDIGFFDALALLPNAWRLDLSTMQTHVITGSYRTFLVNFTFTDQEARQQVLREVYGLEAEETFGVSQTYTKWLTSEGFTSAKYINIAQSILAWSKDARGLTAEQKAACETLEAAHDEAALAFDEAAATMRGDARDALIHARNKLRKEIENAVKVLEYPEKIVYKAPEKWNEDSMINEYWFNWS